LVKIIKVNQKKKTYQDRNKQHQDGRLFRFHKKKVDGFRCCKEHTKKNNHQDHGPQIIDVAILDFDVLVPEIIGSKGRKNVHVAVKFKH
jgi:hypothetical protein